MLWLRGLEACREIPGLGATSFLAESMLAGSTFARKNHIIAKVMPGGITGTDNDRLRVRLWRTADSLLLQSSARPEPERGDPPI